METTSPYLFLVLVLLFSVSGVCATVENSEDDFEENNQRVDAEQDPYTKVTLAPKSGDATSTLFRSCLESSRTFDAKFASIETPGGIEYIRYVPDSSMLAAIPVTWENAVGSVSDIFGCTSVAEAGGYSMFKYSASGCQLSRQEYDLETVPACEDNATDAVFIKLVMPPCCPYPYTLPGTACNGTSVTVTRVNDQPGAKTKCSNEGALLFSPEQPGQIPLLKAYLETSGKVKNYWTNARQVGGKWRWNGGNGRPILQSEWGTPPTNTATKQCACYSAGSGLVEQDCTEYCHILCVKPASWCP